MALSRARSDNSIRYRNNKLGGLDVVLQYSFNSDVTGGESFSNRKLGQQYGGTLAYTAGPFQIGGGYQLSRSSANSDFDQRVWNLNASFKVIEEVKLFAGYLNGRDETGWVNAVMGNTDGGAGLQRKDSGYFLGATYSPGVWSFTAAGYYDRSKNVVEEGDKGRRWAVVGVAEYALSKRTQLYGTVDFNKVSDAASSEIPGGSTQLGAAVGMRHIF